MHPLRHVNHRLPFTLYFLPVTTLHSLLHRYPPFWVPVALLHAAMAEVEPVTQTPRGWALVTAYAPAPQSSSAAGSVDGASVVGGSPGDSAHPGGSLGFGAFRAAFTCCQDDGTHASCSTLCRAPHV